MSDEMRPARLWRNLPNDLRVAAATAFWTDEQAALEQGLQSKSDEFKRAGGEIYIPIQPQG